MNDLALQKRVEPWLHEPFDQKTRAQVQDLIDHHPEKLADAFFKTLSFGTGGMRGLMGVGTNRLNIYTIRAATQGFANYLKKQPKPSQSYSVFIGYDVRHQSKEFAEETARTLAGNGIRVLLTKTICPTPLVSYGCRYFGCSGAVMITASHNPPAYNGYKVYWKDGGQVIFPHDIAIVQEVEKQTSYADILLSPLDSPLIELIGEELDIAYLQELKKLKLYESQDLKVLYTPLHGTGIRIIPQALASWGYTNVHLVEKQKNPDPQFSNAPSPNPEEEKALALGTEELLKTKGDLLIATDPDADRMGVVVNTKKGPIKLTGNQTASLCLYHICTALKEKGKFPANAAFIKTIVTTELFRAIAESFHGKCFDVLTGFKYIGEQITLWEKGPYQYLFGAEESYGYLFGTMVRDKDAVSSACLIAEVVAHAKSRGLSLLDLLYQLYETYGIYRESLSQMSFSDSASGMSQMQVFMKNLREHIPRSINHLEVVVVEDYLTREAQDLRHQTSSSLSLPASDVLRFWLSDGSKLVIRPSGTEPKIKIYAEVFDKGGGAIEERILRCDERLEKLVKDH